MDNHQNQPPPPPPDARKKQRREQSVAAGFVWLFAQSVVGRLIGLVSQFVLAALLAPEAFGLLALAQTAFGIATQVQAMGIRAVLVQRRRRVRPWVNPAWWFAVASGLALALLLAYLAPLLAIIYRDPGVIAVTLVLALTPLFQSPATVPDAILRGQKRFKAVAMIEFNRIVLQALLAVALAGAGLGALALAIPFPVTAAITLALAFRAAKPTITRKLQAKRWRFLLGSGGRITAGNAALVAVNYGDFFALGLFHPSAIVGLYFFAFRLSSQIVPIISNNVRGVLVPSLADFEKDTDAANQRLLRATAIMSLIAYPVALLHVAFAVPVINLIEQFTGDDKWQPAGTILQILAAGMAWRIVRTPSTSVILAQRRYTTKMLVNIAMGITFLAVVVPTAALTGPLGVAAAVTAYHGLWVPVLLHIAGRPGHLRPAATLSVSLRPLLIAAAATAAAYAATLTLPETPFHTWRSALLGSAVGIAAFTAASVLLAKGVCIETLQHAASVAPGPAKKPVKLARRILKTLPAIPWAAVKSTG